MPRINKQQAIATVGQAAVGQAMNGNCDFTNRVTEGTKNAGFTEFSASVATTDQDGDAVTLVAYWYQPEEDVAEAEGLDSLVWDEPTEFEVV